jgi:hypothetical protein
LTRLVNPENKFGIFLPFALIATVLGWEAKASVGKSTRLDIPIA